MPGDPGAAAVARRFIDHLLARDVDGLASLYADDAVVWRNFDRRELSKEQTVKVLGFLCAKVKDLTYDNVRVQETPTGYVQQHVLKGIAPNGESFAADACLVVTVKDGKIARLDEYIDGAQLKPLMS